MTGTFLKIQDEFVGEAIRTVSKDSKAVRSKLYSPDFETEFRKKQL